MSGLAGMLAGHVAPCVAHWHAHFDPADVRHTVEHAGWGFAHVDAVGLETKPEVLAAFKDALGLPSYVGGNLDSIWDGLRELSGPTVVLWDEWGPLARADETAFKALVGLLSDRAQQGGFSVLLRGEGPETGLPSLD